MPRTMTDRDAAIVAGVASNIRHRGMCLGAEFEQDPAGVYIPAQQLEDWAGALQDVLERASAQAPEAEGCPKHYLGDGQVTAERAIASMLAPAEGTVPHRIAYWWACAFKYLWRWPFKGQAKSDLAKCTDCIRRLDDWTAGR